MKTTYIFAIIVIILLMFMAFRSDNKFQFLRAGFMFVIGLVLSTINLMILFTISEFMVKKVKSVTLGNLFLLLGIFVVISGIVIYGLMRLLERFVKFTPTSLSILEYYIQWSLIYITVYQVLFNNATNIHTFTKFIKVGNFLDPNILTILILPSFISIWIATILFKKHINKL